MRKLRSDTLFTPKVAWVAITSSKAAGGKPRQPLL